MFHPNTDSLHIVLAYLYKVMYQRHFEEPV